MLFLVKFSIVNTTPRILAFYPYLIITLVLCQTKGVPQWPAEEGPVGCPIFSVCYYEVLGGRAGQSQDLVLLFISPCCEDYFELPIN